MFSFDLKNLSLGKAVNLSAIFFGSLIAPCWFLFQFAPALFEKTDLTKLLLLAAGIGIPVLIINFGIELLFTSQERMQEENNKKDGNATLMLFRNAATAAAVAFYIPCIALFFGAYSLKWAITTIIYFHVGYLIFNAIPHVGYWLTHKVFNKEGSTKVEGN